MRRDKRRDHLTHAPHILRILSDFSLPRFAAERVCGPHYRDAMISDSSLNAASASAVRPVF
jgi:hypothetical protein